ncbi:MAG: hypothetical protein FWG98_02940 [Candidatus Cloacimonetes bacterium]|nr:hypothetical protein [Candidatus Cloacimonadota bacterium]
MVEIGDFCYGWLKSEISATGVRKSEISATGVRKSEISATDVMKSEISDTGVMKSEISATGVRKSEISATGVRKSEISATDNIHLEPNLSGYFVYILSEYKNLFHLSICGHNMIFAILIPHIFLLHYFSKIG